MSRPHSSRALDLEILFIILITAKVIIGMLGNVSKVCQKCVQGNILPVRMVSTSVHLERRLGGVHPLALGRRTCVRGRLRPVQIPKVIFGGGIATFDDLRANQAEVASGRNRPDISSHEGFQA